MRGKKKTACALRPSFKHRAGSVAGVRKVIIPNIIMKLVVSFFCVLVVGVCWALEPAQNTGAMFIAQPDLLMAGLYWTVAVDINITNYSLIIHKFITEVEQLKAIRVAGLDDEGLAIAQELATLITQETEVLTIQANQVQSQLSDLYHTLMPGARRERRQLLVGALAGAAATVGFHYLFGKSSTSELNAINHRVNTLEMKTAGVLHLLTEQITYMKDSNERESRH